MPAGTTAPGSAQRMLQLPLDSIEPNPEQPRKTFPERQRLELEASIRSAGLVQPIVVRKIDGGKYQIVAGERRYRAFKALAGEDDRYTTITAVLHHLSDAEAQVASLVENLMRQDLNPIERGRGLKALKARLGLTWREVALRVGLSERSVHLLAGLLKLRKEFQDSIQQGLLTEKHGRALKKLAKNREAAFELFEFMLKHPDITGDEALALATVLRDSPGFTPEDARVYLNTSAMPPVRKGPDATPAMQVTRGLKTFLKTREDIDTLQFSEEERASLSQLVEASRQLLDLLSRRLARTSVGL